MTLGRLLRNDKILKSKMTDIQPTGDSSCGGSKPAQVGEDFKVLSKSKTKDGLQIEGAQLAASQNPNSFHEREQSEEQGRKEQVQGPLIASSAPTCGRCPCFGKGWAPEAH